MRRLLVVSIGLAALMVGIVLAWSAVRQEREFQRLIVAGDVALGEDQTYGAIEAYSGALALNPDSMLPVPKARRCLPSTRRAQGGTPGSP